MEIGKGAQRAKIAYTAEGVEPGTPAARQYMNNVRKTMNQAAGGYDTAINLGKPDDAITWPVSEQASLEGMQQYFSQVATAACGS